MATVRLMTESDIRAVSAIRVTGWQAAYPGMVPQAYLDALSVEHDTAMRRERFHRQSIAAITNFVATDAENEVAGWACLGPYRGSGTEDPAAGELYAIYVKPSLIGTGVGRELIHAVHQHAAARGFHTLHLWVLRDNARARRFYERAGYAPDGDTKEDDFAGAPVAEVRYRITVAEASRGRA
ncbi:MAG TPA: GNAT family N-acetyltransferase [Trebonia sp.]|nr:GNAT family N-acetyltransferase [Trebonia sp.]